MRHKQKLRAAAAGTAAGAVNGLFGAGGGMLLVPMLSNRAGFSETEVFSSSVLIILPMCLVTLGIHTGWQLPWKTAWPYLLGGGIGGILAAIIGKYIPLLWLHRFLGVLILYAGVKYIC